MAANLSEAGGAQASEQAAILLTAWRGFFAVNETAMVIRKMPEIDPNVQLEPFMREVLDAYVKDDVKTLKSWLSDARHSVHAALTKQYTTNVLMSDGKILDIRNVDVLQARYPGPGRYPSIHRDMQGQQRIRAPRSEDEGAQGWHGIQGAAGHLRHRKSRDWRTTLQTPRRTERG
ncbi:hypothetical protein FN846DRAFT_1002264 [Sphaerosporella brunnea]|uniref:Tim44-like domain-containing protein n=1 Tax=Sphaerosporella brunnea TaxID=1250544 RepID=A0A5J5F5F3_9PEZI|nr:hypothetical protein FN846DRAFT_1002264 [Sphaerosporella brunnea]